MLPEYTFVPWLRRGAAAEIGEPDSLAAVLDAGLPGRATVPAELTLDVVALDGTPLAARPAVGRSVPIRGPGDVEVLREAAILRVHPANGATGLTPGELAYVEFYDEDLPWRYTPARATDSRLRPWLGLLVLTATEFEVQRRDDAPDVLTLAPGAVLPPVTETWAWAHAQISGTVTAPKEVGPRIAVQPDHSIARLLSPRRLVPATQYSAFLVPAFDTGRLSGLGRPWTAVASQRPAWGTPAHENDRELPILYEFSFATGAAGDFETLARALQPGSAGASFGKRDLDVSAPGYGMPVTPGATVGLEGALIPPAPTFVREPFAPDGAAAGALQPILDGPQALRGSGGVSPAADPLAGDDPLVVPPAYGRWHAGLTRLADPLTATGQDYAWLGELNLDLRNRAAAGVGAQIVRENEEEYLQRAWEQVGEVESANQRLREAELARATNETLLRKHIAQAGDEDRILVLTAAVQPGLPATAGLRDGGPLVVPDHASFRGCVDVSRVPAAAQSPAFRRITRPQRPVMRRLTGGQDAARFQQRLLTDMNRDPGAALTTAPPAPTPPGAVELAAVTGAAQDAAAGLAGPDDPGRGFVMLARADLAGRAGAGMTDWTQLDAAAFGNSIATVALSRWPDGTPPGQPDLGRRVADLARTVLAVRAGGQFADVEVVVRQDAFAKEFGTRVAGRSMDGVVVRGSAPPPDVTAVPPIAQRSDAEDFVSGLGVFGSAVEAGRPWPPAAGPLPATAGLAADLLARLAPAVTIGGTMAALVPVIADRAGAGPPRLAPVMVYPRLPDPMFEQLRRVAPDWIIPNIVELEPDSLTVLEPNRRFIESYLAGLNYAFAQELLWREYPTDQRGSPFTRFWDVWDVAAGGVPGDDVDPLDCWRGPLGSHNAGPAQLIVLVVRGQLLTRYPGTVIYAQQAAWGDGGRQDAPRALDPGGEIRYPRFQSRIDPDITLLGFPLSVQEAKGSRTATPQSPANPGWFFVFMERPGEARFGLDDVTPAAGLGSWNDLAWDALQYPGGAPMITLAPNADLAPRTPGSASWGRTSADMAAILLQRPVLLARHASQLLP